MKEHHCGIYTAMLMDESLWDHLYEIDQSCKERLDRIVAQMAERENVTEALKAADQMEWVHRTNSIHSRAEEIIMADIVRSGLASSVSISVKVFSKQLRYAKISSSF